MAYLKLYREPPDGKAVRGKLYLSLPLKAEGPAPSLAGRLMSSEHQRTPHSGGPIFLCSTLENLDYLIPALIYPLTVTYSPKFKRPLPLVNGVPKEIKQQRRASASDRESQQANKELCDSAYVFSDRPKERTPGIAMGQGKNTASAEWSASHVDVKEYRSGIRFHPGTKPEHSRGCILVSRADEEKLKALILSDNETRIEIN